MIAMPLKLLNCQKYKISLISVKSIRTFTLLLCYHGIMIWYDMIILYNNQISIINIIL